jgi:hypothetical protein
VTGVHHSPVDDGHSARRRHLASRCSTIARTSSPKLQRGHQLAGRQSYHSHIHLIPRRPGDGDVEEPRGGFRAGPSGGRQPEFYPLRAFKRRLCTNTFGLRKSGSSKQRCSTNTSMRFIRNHLEIPSRKFPVAELQVVTCSACGPNLCILRFPEVRKLVFSTGSREYCADKIRSADKQALLNSIRGTRSISSKQHVCHGNGYRWQRLIDQISVSHCSQPWSWGVAGGSRGKDKKSNRNSALKL